MRFAATLKPVGLALAVCGFACLVPQTVAAEAGVDSLDLPEVSGFLEMHDRAVADYLKGEFDKALAGFNSAIAANPKAALAFYNRGNVHYAKGDFAAAIADFTEALRLNPVQPFAHMNRGNALSNLGKLDEALADLNEAVRLQPGISDTWFNRAIVHARRRDLDKALADYETAIARDAKDEGAAAARERVLALLGRDGGTDALDAADTARIMSEIAHARYVEHVMRLVANSCIAHGDNLEGLKTLAVVGGWTPATAADLIRGTSARTRMDGGWTFTDRFGSYAVIRLVTAASPPVYVCSLTTQPVTVHLLADLTLAFEAKFGISPIGAAAKPGQQVHRYMLRHDKGTLLTALAYTPKDGVLTFRTYLGNR